MAAAVNRLGYFTFWPTIRIPPRSKALTSAAPPRRFHLSPLHCAREDQDSPKPSKRSQRIRAPYKFNIEDLAPQERSTYKSLPPEGQAQWREEAKAVHEYITSPEMDSMIQGAASQAAFEAQRDTPHAELIMPRIKPGLMAYGEEEVQESGEDEEFQGDDISALGHGELEQHREMREYARIAAWEMPLLSKLAKPFTPPPKDQPLRFRYTTYMGETHPASKKIVLEFCTQDLPDLTEPQRMKLIKVVGPRYNPETDIVKMSSEMFETQAQNKRYLGDLVDTLIAEAKDETDMFEDLPLDFRHHKFKKREVFPDGWRMSKDRKEQLEIDRRQRSLQEKQREEQGLLVDGTQIVEAALRALPVRDESRVLLEAERGGRGKVSRGKAKRLR